MLEKEIEESFVQKLEELKYVYRPDICDRVSLEKNFREKFESLNRVHLTDSEFGRLLEEITDSDVFDTAKKLRERNTFMREDGTPLQYTLVNIKEWCKNEFEIVRQLRINTKNSFQRYDVILLIQGLPVVQIELKKQDVSPRRAMQQIVDYKSDSGNGYANTLLCFIQMFIVSNQHNTYYFANNNSEHFEFNADEQYLPVYQWADESNHKITDLDAFCDAFLKKCKLGEMISRYMVLVACERKMLIMRPYQIYAVKAIVDCIKENRGNGYIWHTTGSGKTLTSFKAATLLKEIPEIQKCLFVVDRKDLDKQTREEFNRFQDGCVEENTNTDTLVRRMLSEDYADKIIVTTIQKLGVALDSSSRSNYQDRLSVIKDCRIVFIFDECHRSQFGENHKAIKEFFPNAQLFGFTGTPIFEENARYTQITGEEAEFKTTKDVFEKELHSYTITNAIEDKNVLRFHVDYFKPDESETDLSENKRKKAVVDSILAKHWAATDYLKFNAFLATSSINDAIEYYKLFKNVQAFKKTQDESYRLLNVVCVFSPPAEDNKDIQQIQEDLLQERLDNQLEPDKKKAALQEIIGDYNSKYGTNHKIADFDAYYQDVQQRIKDQKYSNKDYAHENKIDITIVVDMLLTGFDSKFLNTLYVDKNLKYHQLIQALSRTNRILNDTKPYGNVFDFRAQQGAVDSAIALFSGEKKDCAKKIWLVEPAPTIIEKYRQAVENLRDFMEASELPMKPEEVQNLKGDVAKGAFVSLFKEIQRYKLQLDQYTDIDKAVLESVAKLIPENELQAFRGAYLDIAKQLKTKREKQPDKMPPEIEALDFEFVLFASALIDYDYIMTLIARYAGAATNTTVTKEQLVCLIQSSANLMDERDEILAYIDSLDGVNGKTEQEIKDGYELFKRQKFSNELDFLAEKHAIEYESLKSFADEVVSRKIFDGEKLDDLLEPLDLGWKERAQKESALMEDLAPLLKKMACGQSISGLSAYEAFDNE